MLTSYLEKFNLLQIIAEEARIIRNISSNDKNFFSTISQNDFDNLAINKQIYFLKLLSKDNYYFFIKNIFYEVSFSGEEEIEIGFGAIIFSELNIDKFKKTNFYDSFSMNRINLESDSSIDFWDQLKIILKNYHTNNPNKIYTFVGAEDTDKVNYKKGKISKFNKAISSFYKRKIPTIFYSHLLELQSHNNQLLEKEIVNILNDYEESEFKNKFKKEAGKLLKKYKSSDKTSDYIEFFEKIDLFEKQIRDMKDINERIKLLENILLISKQIKIGDTLDNEFISKTRYYINQFLSSCIFIKFLNELKLKVKQTATISIFIKENIDFFIDNLEKECKFSSITFETISLSFNTLISKIISITQSDDIEKEIFIKGIESTLKDEKIKKIFEIKKGLDLHAIFNDYKSISLKDVLQFNFIPKDKFEAHEIEWNNPSTYLEFTDKAIERNLNTRELKYYKFFKKIGVTNFSYDGNTLRFKWEAE